MKWEYWRNEVAKNPGDWSMSDIARVADTRAPKGIDNFPMEVHHIMPLCMAEAMTSTT